MIYRDDQLEHTYSIFKINEEEWPYKFHINTSGYVVSMYVGGSVKQSPYLSTS